MRYTSPLLGTLLAAGLFAAVSTDAIVAEPGAKKEAKSCCEQQLACCNPPSACCVADVPNGCCKKGMKCCAEKRACCTGVQKCCLEGSACCDQKKACCGPAAGDKAAALDGLPLFQTSAEAPRSCCAGKRAGEVKSCCRQAAL